MPAPPFAHVLRMSDGHGIFEHASGTTPRTEEGYCLDDVARALIVMCREPVLDHRMSRVAAVYFDFVLEAQAASGAFHNRMDRDGRWTDEPDLGDWWGRGMWALGTAAARSQDPWIRATAAGRFERGATRRSPNLRSMAFACLGAAEIATVAPGRPSVTGLFRDYVDRVGPGVPAVGWPWPEPRLAYANGAVAEALLAAGDHLRDPAVRRHGLDLLGWLVATETHDGHLSTTPVGGRGPGDPRPGYDQQPIEVAALADACARARDSTGDPRWSAGLDLAVGWFLGDNDQRRPMWDEASGGGFDALTPTGRNTNQGAESTLAMVATLQHARVPSVVGR